MKGEEVSAIHLAHLSDFHIAANPVSKRLSGHTKEVFREACARVSEWRAEGRLDFLLVTGDCANTGLQSDVHLTSEMINNISPRAHSPEGPRAVRPQLPLVLLPGNHDRFGAPAKAFPSSTEFDRAFHLDWSGGLGGVCDHTLTSIDGGIVLNEQAGAPVLAVICADLCLLKGEDARGRWGSLGQGRSYKRSVERMGELTRSLQLKGYAVVWAIHFAPQYEKYSRHHNTVGSANVLLGGKRVARYAQKHNVNHVFCGHTHMWDTYRVAADPPVWIHCAGSSACLSRAPHKRSYSYQEFPRIHRCYIEVSSNPTCIVTTDTFVWKQGTFVREGSSVYRA